MTTGVFPASKLEVARGGILDVATVTHHPDSYGQWTNGVFGWDTVNCPVDLILSDFCTNAAEGVIAVTDPGGVPSAWPFGIITKYHCLTLGMKVEERKRIALLQNEVGTQKAVEHELWAGAIAHAANHLVNPYLASSQSVDVTIGGGAGSVRLGIAALEQALADCGLGAQGVIHMSRSAALIATTGNVVTWDGNVLRTQLGTKVVAGVGYDPKVQRAAAAPAVTPVPAPAAVSAAPADQWMYASGPVSVHLGPSEIIDNEPMVNIRTNEVSVLAGRPAAVYWDSCCTFAAHVDLTQ